MISEGIVVAMLGRTSHGFYRGRFEEMIEEVYPAFFESSLKQEITKEGLTRGHFFKKVLLAERTEITLEYQLQASYWGN